MIILQQHTMDFGFVVTQLTGFQIVAYTIVWFEQTPVSNFVLAGNSIFPSIGVPTVLSNIAGAWIL
jgi:hypothetical protein